MTDFWLFLGALWILSWVMFFGLSIYLAIFRNPSMDRFLYNNDRFAEAISAGGIPFGVLRAGEYGIYFIICRLFNKPITKFFRNAKKGTPEQSTVLYELNVVFGLLFIALLSGVYFFG